jgi:hypothetical protein
MRMKSFYIYCSMNRLLLALFISTALALSANPGDSIVTFRDLRFTGDAEKEAFTQLARKGQQADLLALLMRDYAGENYSLNAASRKINEFVEALRNRIDGLDEKKQVKILFNEVHRHFFQVYSLHNSFADVFRKGEYNCLSGTTLYAMVLEKLKIPYHVIEAPRHVYVLAYPNTHKIVLESTDPQKGYFPLSPKSREKIIQGLVASKAISEQDYAATSMEQLFDRHYFSAAPLDLRDAVAGQFANYASYRFEDDDAAKALEEIKKAYYISPTERNRNILFTILATLLSSNAYKDSLDAQRFALVCRLKDAGQPGISNEQVTHEFGKLTEELLTTRSDLAGYKGAWRTIAGSTRDSSLMNGMEFIYHYEIVRFYLTAKLPAPRGEEHLSRAYSINPRHNDLQTLILMDLTTRARHHTDIAQTISLSERYASKYPAVGNTPLFGEVHSEWLLEASYRHSTLNDVKSAESYLQKFETFAAGRDSLKVEPYMVEKAYGSLATYYYKKGNAAKTREILRRGLRYSPGNWGLSLRLQQAR